MGRVRFRKTIVGMEPQHLPPGGDPIPINAGPIAAETEPLNHGTWIKRPSSYGIILNTGSGVGERSPVDRTHRPQPDDEEQPTNPTTKPLDPNRFKSFSENDLVTNGKLGSPQLNDNTTMGALEMDGVEY